jgi:menaquinone-dependent protoporphyrinogen oxidase
MKILVGYASAHGSTAEIAEFIGKELADRDFDVTVMNVADVTNVDAYNAFVLGSAIHAGMWLAEMSQFFERFQAKLKTAPIAFFVTCVRVLEEGGYEHVMREYINHKVLDPLNIREITAFAGRLEMNAVDWDERWTLAARYDGLRTPGTYNNDFRDWQAIRRWARRMADHLLLPG